MSQSSKNFPISYAPKQKYRYLTVQTKNLKPHDEAANTSRNSTLETGKSIESLPFWPETENVKASASPSSAATSSSIPVLPESKNLSWEGDKAEKSNLSHIQDPRERKLATILWEKERLPKSPRVEIDGARLILRPKRTDEKLTSPPSASTFRK